MRSISTQTLAYFPLEDSADCLSIGIAQEFGAFARWILFPPLGSEESKQENEK